MYQLQLCKLEKDCGFWRDRLVDAWEAENPCNQYEKRQVCGWFMYGGFVLSVVQDLYCSRLQSVIRDFASWSKAIVFHTRLCTLEILMIHCFQKTNFYWYSSVHCVCWLVWIEPKLNNRLFSVLQNACLELEVNCWLINWKYVIHITCQI